MTNVKTKVDELKEALKKKNELKEKAKAEVEGEEAAKGQDEGELETQIRAAEEDAKRHYDKLLKVMAEFENFKKRMAKEREGLVRYSNEKLLVDLLPALDDLDRVLDHVPPDAGDEVKKFAEGVELVRKNLLAVLERYDMKEVPSLGEKFDPAMHEAIAMIESEGREPGSVIAVNRKGYRLADRLLRPALVTVCKGE